VLDLRKNSIEGHLWQNTEVFADYIEMLDKCKPNAVFIGVPPENHGTTISPNNIETECCKRKIHMFIEKPLSCASISQVSIVADQIEEQTKNGLVVSVGYMFRYSQAVLKMKEIIQSLGVPKAFNARYDCAYSTLSKEMWWDVNRSGGPIIEQATHFCDMARFLVGEVDLDTVRAIAIKQTDPNGELKSLPSNIHENELPPERRIPRVTSAFWKFKNGAIGTLMHAALLHGIKYESELEVWGDGYRIVLLDPYTKCRLSVRDPSSEQERIITFYDDDSYLNEDRVFLEAVLDKSKIAKIQSPYSDAINTYKLTWAIRDAAE